jgi:hypothetical protein
LCKNCQNLRVNGVLLGKTLNRIVLQAAAITVLAFFCHCNTGDKTTFAIRDFKKSLQPYLIKVVSIGVVPYDPATEYIQSHATDEELERLSKSEHPVLRAVAFRAMLERPGFDHFAVIMNNLSDTALVAVHKGEWGIQYVRVSDDIIENGRWKDTVARKKTMEKLILNHNYLTSAYDALSRIEPGPQHYPLIKNMIERHSPYSGDGNGILSMEDISFETRENALFALAGYKKPEDVPYIKNVLQSHVWEMGSGSFLLMQEYQNESYLEVYEEYLARHFYHRICREQTTFYAELFIKSVATYKNERSAKILNAILNRKPLLPCSGDTSMIEHRLAYAIWENKCDAYAKLVKQVEPLIKKWEPGMPGLDVDPYVSPPDTSGEPVRWWH